MFRILARTNFRRQNFIQVTRLSTTPVPFKRKATAESHNQQREQVMVIFHPFF